MKVTNYAFLLLSILWLSACKSDSDSNPVAPPIDTASSNWNEMVWNKDNWKP